MLIEKKEKNIFDVVVVGGGHAGVEAALASSRMGSKTLLITQNIETIGQMSCNPAIGGIGKSHLVKEIDSLGGVMAQAIDKSGIHFRVLNSRKGPAVRATRVQADRSHYRSAIREFVDNQENLLIFQDTVDDLIVTKNVVLGVVASTAGEIKCKSVILTVGTFLGGVVHIGLQKKGGGRASDPASNALSKRLRALPFRVARLKTGTPPRIDKRTIDFSCLTPQPGDNGDIYFSQGTQKPNKIEQVSCYIAKTNSKTIDIIRKNLNKSSMYSGNITGTGPRYCPSIEDKVGRFEKTDHQIFIEPEGLNSCEVYPNGISTSLPFDVQTEYVRSIKGLEKAHITRPGYAIEYDYLDPRDLKMSLESTILDGLFLAGQINGTTGYEEAASQGIVAGINASRSSSGKEPWIPKRSSSYMGVLIDDLTTKGTQEPYRMFTSRSEYRLLLREDNADDRLIETGYNLGVVSKSRYQDYLERKKIKEGVIKKLHKTFVYPCTQLASVIESIVGNAILREYPLFEILKRPQISIFDLDVGFINEIDREIANQIDVEIKYEGYINRQEKEVEKLHKIEKQQIPKGVDFSNISGLSIEIREKLKSSNPKTLGQAYRIPGVTPAAISLISIYLKKYHHEDVIFDV